MNSSTKARSATCPCELVVAPGNPSDAGGPELELTRRGSSSSEWLARYPNLVGVCLNHNSERTNTIFGSETRCIAGRLDLREEFAGLQFQVQPDTFFQIHTEQAEALLAVILEQLQLQGDEIVVDAYCGIGTLSLPLAQRVQQVVIGLKFSQRRRLSVSKCRAE